MTYETLLVERRGEKDGILWLTLNRPERLNALSLLMFEELRQVFVEARRDRDLQCLVITGAGRGFCAGADHSGSGGEASGPQDMDAHRLGFRAETETFVAMRRLEIPTLAAVNGVCVGAAFDMVAAMDLAVASTAARYQVAYVKRGLYPDLGGFWALPKVIGWRKAMEMMLTGRFMSAEEAHEAGLTNYLVEPDKFEAKVMELALEVEAGPAVAQRLAKMLAHRTASLDYESALEWSGTALPIVMASEDRAEGVRSFLEKRQPRFSGR